MKMYKFIYVDSEDGTVFLEATIPKGFKDELLEIYKNEPAWEDYSVSINKAKNIVRVRVVSASQDYEEVAKILEDELALLGKFYNWSVNFVL